jgi:hypothetical protein
VRNIIIYRFVHSLTIIRYMRDEEEQDTLYYYTSFRTEWTHS